MVLTISALCAFAANSVLCRLALGTESIDAASFTTIRLTSGAIILSILAYPKLKTPVSSPKDNLSFLMLFTYAVTFSFAYNTLTTATGALILFGMVQITMVISSIRDSNSIPAQSWIGLALATCGLVYLLLPGASAPPLIGALLMGISGVAWGLYTLKGKKAQDPLRNTAVNFIKSVPLAIIISLIFWADFHANQQGILLAILSGVIASGVGYVIWYAALRHITTLAAAVSQLSVPIIAALGGVLFVAEPITLRLTIASLFVVCGIYLVISQNIGARSKTIKS